MTSNVTAYPLDWPPAWPREQHPQVSSFKTGLITARDGLIRELELLGADGVVISTNAELNTRGEISARQRRIDDTGAVAYFRLDDEDVCIPCDKWTELKDNLRALELTVGALRGLERWGAREIVRRAFTGFAALPAGSHWSDVLGVSPDAGRDEIERVYRRLARERHPDVAGGSVEAFRELNEAYQTAITEGRT